MKVYKPFLVFLILLLILPSCKKDKLQGDKSVLIGTWNWEFSIKKTDDFSDSIIPNSQEKMLAENCGDSYSLIFEEKGIVKSLKNEKVSERERIVFEGFFETNSDNVYKGSIELNGNADNCLQFTIIGDTLICQPNDFTGLPLNSGDLYHEITYLHYYIKE